MLTPNADAVEHSSNVPWLANSPMEIPNTDTATARTTVAAANVRARNCARRISRPTSKAPIITATAVAAAAASLVNPISSATG